MIRESIPETNAVLRMKKITLPVAIALSACAGLDAGTQGASDIRGVQGPRSSQTPYVTPTGPGWHVTSIISAGALALGPPSGPCAS